MSKQQRLDGSFVTVQDLADDICGNCLYHYWKEANGKKYGKCDIKPRGWGYDVPKKHICCFKFKKRTCKNCKNASICIIQNIKKCKKWKKKNERN
jgi:hypothetical protein